MTLTFITIGANNNRRGYFDGYSADELEKIAKTTFEWSVNHISKLGVFDNIVLFADSDYQHTEWARKEERYGPSRLSILRANGDYFLRANDKLIYESEVLKDDDYLFSAHMDAFISKHRYEFMLEKAKTHKLVAGINYYRHNCTPIIVDGKEVSWWADHCLLVNVGWMRQHNFQFSWGPCYRETQDYYLNMADCPISIKGQDFITLDDPSRDYPSRGNGLSFDGFQEASLKIGLFRRAGSLPDSDIYSLGDAQVADHNMMHLKSFFMQDDGKWKCRSNNMIVNTVILGRSPEKDRFVGTEDNEYGNNPRLELEEIRETSLYSEVWNDKERERFESLLA